MPFLERLAQIEAEACSLRLLLVWPVGLVWRMCARKRRSLDRWPWAATIDDMADGHFWMTTAEVAAELGRSTETIRRYVRERRLRAAVIVINGRATIRISRGSFDEFRRRYVRDTIDDDWE